MRRTGLRSRTRPLLSLLIAAVTGAATEAVTQPAKAGIPPYTINTVAGSDQNGDGGPASQAFVSILQGVCADAAGNIYIADADDNRIRKIDTSGVITTFAGAQGGGFGGDGGPAAQAFLQSPYGIRFDSSGALYVADLGNNRIRKITPDGNISTFASGLNAPRNLAFDAHGNLYVSEFNGNQVTLVGADGSRTPFAGNGTAGFSGDGGRAVDAELNGPAGIAFDPSGNLFIADSGNAVIREVSTGGTIVTAAGTGAAGNPGALTISEPTGLAVDSEGNVYVTNVEYPETFVITTTGMVRQLAGVGRDIALTSAGDLLLAGNQHLQELSPASTNAPGTLTTIIGPSPFVFGDGGPAVNARFESVTSLAVDGQGDIVVVDTAFRRVREVLAGGDIETLPISDYTTHPVAVAFNAGGQMLIGDNGNVDVVSASGSPTVLSSANAPAGIAANANVYFTSGNALFEIQGSTTMPVAGSASPQLNGPTALAVAADGTIYIADTGNGLIRHLGADGSLSTIAGTTPGFSGDEGPAAQAQLSGPAGLCFDPSGNLWIADTANSRIRVIDTTGTIHTAAGTGDFGFSGDGNPAAFAALSSPAALACDAKGNVFIADSGNRRVRELTVGTGGDSGTGSGSGTGSTGGSGGTSGAPEASVTVTQAATFKPGPIAGGEIVTLFGANIGPSTAMGGQLDSTGKLATVLGRTQVLFNGIAAPLYYVGTNQINAEVPVEVGGSVSALVTVENGGSAVAGTVVDITPYSPGLFAAGANAAALNQNLSVNSTNNPAAPNSIIVLYGTGFGETNPLDITGQPAAPPLGIPLGYVSVTIGGTAATVLYAGDAPGFAGLTQVNARIPAGLTGQQPVSVTAGNVTATAAPSIWVQ